MQICLFCFGKKKTIEVKILYFQNFLFFFSNQFFFFLCFLYNFIHIFYIMFGSNRFSFSYNSLNQIATISDLSAKNLSSSNQLSKPLNTNNKQPQLLTNFQTVLWLKKRYQNKAKAKYFLPPDERDLNKILNQVFGLYCNDSKVITLMNFWKIFEFCRVPLEIIDVFQIFFMNHSNNSEKEFLSLKEFKRKFLSEKKEAQFSLIIKNLRTKGKFNKNQVFLPSSLKEVVDFLGYKLKRSNILKHLNEEEDIKGKIKGMKDLFSIKVETKKKKVESKENINKLKNRKRSLESPFFSPYKSGFFTPTDEEEEFELKNLKESMEKEKHQIKEKISEDIQKNQGMKGKKMSLPILKELKMPMVNISGIRKKVDDKKLEKIPIVAREIMDFNMNSARSSHECKMTSRILNFYKK